MRDTSLSFWFPILCNLKINVPKTIIIDVNGYDLNCVPAMKKVFWMKEELTEAEKKSLGQMIATIKMLGKEVGYPFFLRTGHTSNKHDWNESCFIENENKLPTHIQNIFEHSLMANMEGGFPINIWVIRKMIPTEAYFYAFSGNMPITKEIRIFFDKGKVLCIHPYWPKDSFHDMTSEKDWEIKYQKLVEFPDGTVRELRKLTNKIAQHFEGFWSIDWLLGKDNKWYAIDMAIGEDCYHYPGCKFEKYNGK